jgi:Nuclease-related domain
MNSRIHGMRKLAVEWTHHLDVFQVFAYSFMVLSFHAVVILPFKTAFPVSILFLACARYFFILARDVKQKRDRLEVGLDAETGLHAMLLKKLPLGWLIEANVAVPHRGDVDLFVTSPSSKHYAIEIKSHQTEVLFDGRKLRRGNCGSFEKDFLRQAVGAAVALRRMRKLSYVNAVLVFTRATLSLVDNQIGYVKVLRSEELTEYLVSQERGGTPKFDQPGPKGDIEGPRSHSSILGELTRTNRSCWG